MCNTGSFFVVQGRDILKLLLHSDRALNSQGAANGA